MEKQRKTEDQLKADIYSVYLHCKEESSSSSRQTDFGKLCPAIFRWCTDYLFKGVPLKGWHKDFNVAHLMGEEIFNTVLRIFNGKNVPKDKDRFFNYLKKSLNRARFEYYRKQEESDIKISRNKRKQLQNIESIITIKEGNLGKKLTEDERKDIISRWFPSKWFGTSEYFFLVNVKNAVSLEKLINKDDSDTELNLLDKDIKSIFMESASATTHDNSISKHNAQIIQDALETVLNKKQARSRECYRALITGHIIEKIKDFECLSPVLSSEILEEFKITAKNPMQHEIYLKYHPNIKKESAEARSSEMLKKLLNDLRIIIKKES